LFEAGEFPRHKVCGEFVTGEALELLTQLVGSDELPLNAPRISRARVFIDDQVLQFPVDPAAVSISRWNLDLLLWQGAIRSGVDSRSESRVHSYSRIQDRFLVRTGKAEVQARAVVNATGRWSNLTKQRPQLRERWIGIKSHFVELDPSDSCDLYFFEGGYCGVQPLADYKVNAAAMVRADVARSMSDILRQNKNLALRSFDWKPRMEPVTVSPLFFRPPLTSENGVALCGDAAAFLDPFAGDGISMALHSGAMAATEFATYLTGECSPQAALLAYDRAYREFLEPVLKTGAQLRRLIQLPRLGRFAAASLLKFPPLARLAVKQTRSRHRVAG
jgi:flavin-dependent dehydrogenase